VTDSTEILVRALDQAADALANVEPSDFDGPTPCTEWSVAHLVSHLVADPRNFVLMATDGEPDWSVEPADPDSDWVGAFRAAADDLVAFWRESGDAEASMDWQTGELAVHTWDLVRATGQPVSQLDVEVGQTGFDFMSKSLTPENRGEVFKPEQPADEAANVYDRLAAFAGRDPSWQRP
jgi:uncharacterized protein (TIGR03086 family)